LKGTSLESQYFADSPEQEPLLEIFKISMAASRLISIGVKGHGEF
jgi:hypothetical protein